MVQLLQKDEAPLHVLTCKGLQHTSLGENLKLQMKYTGQTHTNNTPLRLYTGFYICMKTQKRIWKDRTNISGCLEMLGDIFVLSGYWHLVPQGWVCEKVPHGEAVSQANANSSPGEKHHTKAWVGCTYSLNCELQLRIFCLWFELLRCPAQVLSDIKNSKFHNWWSREVSWKACQVLWPGSPKWLGFYASLLEYVNISENKGYPGARPCHAFALRALRQMSHWPGVRQRPRAFKRKSGGPLSGGSWYPQDSLPADPPSLGSSSQPLVRRDTTAMREMCSVFPFNSILSDMHPTIIIEHLLCVKHRAGCTETETDMLPLEWRRHHKQMHINQVIINSDNCYDATTWVMWLIETRGGVNLGQRSAETFLGGKLKPRAGSWEKNYSCAIMEGLCLWRCSCLFQPSQGIMPSGTQVWFISCGLPVLLRRSL